MSAYAELFARFPEQMMALHIEECCREQRPVYLLDTGDNFIPPCPCDWCDQPALFTFTGYDAVYCDPPVPNMAHESTCGAPQCMDAQRHFWGDRMGARRRQQYKLRFGRHLASEPKETMLARALAVMVEAEVRKVANG